MKEQLLIVLMLVATTQAGGSSSNQHTHKREENPVTSVLQTFEEKLSKITLNDLDAEACAVARVLIADYKKYRAARPCTDDDINCGRLLAKANQISKACSGLVKDDYLYWF